VATAAHPGDHRPAHRRSHPEHEQLRLGEAYRIETAAGDACDDAEGEAEGEHPGEHRERHRTEVTEEGR
jgi:hypothetical protein